jgi:hypothetical protein
MFWRALILGRGGQDSACRGELLSPVGVLLLDWKILSDKAGQLGGALEWRLVLECAEVPRQLSEIAV